MTNKYFSDEELLFGLRNHDESVIRNVYNSNWPMVLQFVKLNNGNEEEAKDLYQEGMLDFLEKV